MPRSQANPPNCPAADCTCNNDPTPPPAPTPPPPPSPPPSPLPPAPGSGGASCSLNVTCGIPAANCDTFREKCISSSGYCDAGGHCECDNVQFACGNCAGKAHLDRNESNPDQFIWSTKMPLLNGSRGEIDVCDAPYGGATCKADGDCSPQAGGLCIAGHCVCPFGWVCADCSLHLDDRQFGLQCGKHRNGGKKCAISRLNQTAYCSMHGTCYTGYCHCNPDFACDDCSQNELALSNETAVCPAPAP